jgi:hypothetical protein
VHRLLENEEITPEDVLNLRDSLEYYLDQNQSPDFVFDDAMYDELPMEKLDAKVGEELTSCEGFYCVLCGHESPAPTVGCEGVSLWRRFCHLYVQRGNDCWKMYRAYDSSYVQYSLRRRELGLAPISTNGVRI